MLLGVPTLCPPLHYWSLIEWDSKYPLVCQKNEIGGSSGTQYRICVIDEHGGTPILLVACAMKKEEIKNDWTKICEALGELKERVDPFNVSKQILCKFYSDKPHVK